MQHMPSRHSSLIPGVARRALPALLPIVLAFGSIGLPTLAAADSTPSAQAAQSDLVRQMDAALSGIFKADQPGAAVIVVKDGKTLFRKGYGMADVEKKVPVQAGNVFRLGSITKQFTAVGILMLEEEGRLSLQDEITKFLPDYPTRGKKITVEHLLTHTSGIQSYTGMASFRSIANKELKPLEVVDFFKNEPMEFDPGERYAYNNSGYFLLGVIIEKVSGMTYADFVAKRIFEPLGMRDTAFEGFERIGGGKRIAGYAFRAPNFVAAPPLSMTQPYAAGSLVSTVDDLATWQAAIDARKLLKTDTWARVFTPYTLNNGKKINYAYGWNIRNFRGEPAIEHGGAINGFSTQAIHLPTSRVYVAVLANALGRQPGPGYVAEKLAAMAAGKPFPEPTPITLKPEQLDRFEGTYRIDEKQNRVVMRDGANLVVQRGGNRSVLTPYRDNEFFLPGLSFTRFRFETGADGKVSRLVLLDGPEGDEISPRIGDKPAEKKSITLAAKDFDALTGDYELAPGFVLTIKRDGERYISQATNQGPIEIFAENETTFFTKAIQAELVFKKNAEGQATGLVLKQNGREMPAKKIK